ncbi:type III PLP-dependent enzyme [Yinghuangia sp. YIM S09857]|uniref:type III PLP-dependent enzyme n=1 Tax=Yinghuangia sp. YIM S09857 TaxID=3436929 RepID=UPI003F52D3DA
MGGVSTGQAQIPDTVRSFADTLAERRLPAYVHDLSGLREHTAAIAAALPPDVELHYAAKANPDAGILRAVAPHVHGFEVASGGEYAHVREAVPGKPLAFGGPGKTPAELTHAIESGVHRLHVESEQEAYRVAALARATGRTVEVLLRANPPLDLPGAGNAPLTMGGRPTPFGMDPPVLDRCARLLSDEPRVRLRGLHAHLASGLGADDLAESAARLLAWADTWAEGNRVDLRELNVGGGMAVDYRDPGARFDWPAYGKALGALVRPDGPVLRIEPGRAIAAYHGWYVTDVLDVKHSRGEAFAVVRGGTHHLRTPAARGHAQPFAVLARDGWPYAWPRPAAAGEPVTVVGQLCTPKDVLAARVPVPGAVRAGDRIVFAMAGAYAWNISHRDFLMHAPPTFHYLAGAGGRT